MWLFSLAIWGNVPLHRDAAMVLGRWFRAVLRRWSVFKGYCLAFGSQIEA
jgi:hypothetical protein